MKTTALLMGALLTIQILPVANAADITYRIYNETLFRIDPRLFGQFMERPSWGDEIGPEAAVIPGTHELRPDALALLRQMQIPIIRFPGGSDVDFLDWRDMVSNVPGRGAERPVSVGLHGGKVTNNFGYDEFLRLCEDLKSEPILVMNLRDALMKKTPLEQHAAHAAELVAYCNAPVGAKHPEGMSDWPSVRAKNGHPKPYGVKYWQIGNETWFFFKDLPKVAPQDPDAWYVECVVAMARAMLAVDPTIEFIIDGDKESLKTSERIREQLGNKVACVVFHYYTPWDIREIQLDDKSVPAESLSAGDIWYAWVAAPSFLEDSGLSKLRYPLLSEARKKGFRVAVTEWNWNGWWALKNGEQPAITSSLAKGVGAAGILHGMIRSADVIDIGCQSMLVGQSWGIHAIAVDPEGKTPAYFMPTGQVTMLYSQHHGENLLKMDSSGVPSYEQPYKMGWMKPTEKIAILDALATGNDKTVFFHVINRHFDKPMEATIDLGELGSMAKTARHYVLGGRLDDAPAPAEKTQVAEITSTEIHFNGKTLKVILPPRSVSCIEIPRAASK
jgi:alpha-N-arabinofuranosidase